ncbi:MAG: threonine synthase, partial [archaeon]
MFKCTDCGKTYSEEEIKYKCDSCGSLLKVEREISEPSFKGPGMEKYREVLAVDSDIVTLQEGSTPLYDSSELAQKYELDDVFLKFEGTNPTGSFKDRGSSVAITKALEYGYSSVSLASTGNMAASVAAYSSRARLRSNIYIPYDTPIGKISQVLAYNGNLVMVKGDFQKCLERAKMRTEEGDYLAMTGLNPYYLEGEKTVGYELIHQRKEIYSDKKNPDVLIVPMGTGGLLSSIYWSFKEQKKLGLIDEVPMIIGAQSKVCSPIADAFNEGHKRPRPPQGPVDTIAESIHVKVPFNGHTAVEAMRKTDGFAVKVTDDHIIEAVFEMGKEGVFAEPAGAIPLAALKKIMDPEEEDLNIDSDKSVALM